MVIMGNGLEVSPTIKKWENEKWPHDLISEYIYLKEIKHNLDILYMSAHCNIIYNWVIMITQVSIDKSQI